MAGEVPGEEGTAGQRGTLAVHAGGVKGAPRAKASHFLSLPSVFLFSLCG